MRDKEKKQSIKGLLQMDLEAAKRNDPAAKSYREIKRTYAGYEAIRAYRKAHTLYLQGKTLQARVISQKAYRRTGIEIHPGAEIAGGCFIDHGSGVVIGETAVIGENCTLYQGVTLGGTGKDKGKRHPTLGNNVMVSAGAKVLGPITVGDNSKIGAGSVVLCDVPPNCTVVGIPGRIVKRDGERVELDQSFPDPLLPEFARISCALETLYTEVQKLKEK